MEKESLGQRIRESRLKKGYTQQTLAAKANIGVVYLSQIERGIKMPSMNIFIRIVEVLDVSADYILRNELTSGKEYVYDEILEKLVNLQPKQRKTAADLLEAYIKNL